MYSTGISRYRYPNCRDIPLSIYRVFFISLYPYYLYIAASLQYCHKSKFCDFELYIPLDCPFHDASFAKNDTFLSPNLAVRGLCVSLLRLQKIHVVVVTNETHVNYSRDVNTLLFHSILSYLLVRTVYLII